MFIKLEKNGAYRNISNFQNDVQTENEVSDVSGS